MRKILHFCLTVLLGIFSAVTNAAEGIPEIIVPASLNAKENSVEAFRNGWKMKNVSGVSTYIRRTSDGVLICFQDSNTKRLLGVSKEIHKTIFSELQKLASAKGFSITKFEDVLKELPEGKKLFLEVALYDAPWRFYDNRFLKDFMSVIRDSGIDRNQLVVISADQWALREIRVAMPNVKTLFYNRLVKKHNRKDYTTAVFRTVQEKLRTSGFHGTALALNEIDLKPEEIALLRSRDQEICIWESADGTFGKLACVMADYLRTSDPEAFFKVAEPIREKRKTFCAKAEDYKLVAPYDPAKTPRSTAQ